MITKLVAISSKPFKALIFPGFLFGFAVTATAQEAPVIINQETGAQVDFIRPYWNANVDIASRRIQCDHFVFDQESAAYIKNPNGGSPFDNPWLGHDEFFHHPLSEGRGEALVDHGLAYYLGSGWGVSEGLYSGNAPLGSEFIEVVSYNDSSNVNAVRNWYTSENTSASYHLCYDLDGAPFVPTGSAEIGNTDLLPEQNFTFQLPPSDTPVTEVPEIIRLDTGEAVEFVRAEFDYNEDLKGRGVNCGLFRWNEQYGYVPASRGSGAAGTHEFRYAYTGGIEIPFMYGRDDDVLRFSGGSIDSVLPSSSFIEVVEYGYNMWSSQGSFWGCRVGEVFDVESSGEPFAPNRILLTPQDSCDYSSADQYGEWGWNPATLESCPPLEATPSNNCDYSNADQYGGWGWDPIAQTSCAPNESPVTTVPVNNNEQCDYSNADLYSGWGWNSTLGESCPPQASDPMTPSGSCVDDDNDGWGWNGTDSCQVTAVQCIDPDGDGWGWDGTSSCRV